jgi:hypothetical protein
MLTPLPRAAMKWRQKMTSDRLLTEIERQKKYLAALPKNFEFPLFNSKQALESQRRNGYRNTAAAAREIVDNAIEAKATKIHILFDRSKAANGKEVVSSVAFIDNGSGMLPEIARYALSWGGGTHFDDPNFIGKFGFGLPNASINQTRRVEVYTRTAETEKVVMTYLDADEFAAHGIQTIKSAVEAEIPEFVQAYIQRNNFDFSHGTLVLWKNPDRLTYRTPASLKEHMVDDFGSTYRYLLHTFELKVEGMDVEMVDPLFLDPRGRYFVKESEGGAQLREDRTIPVKWILDPIRGGYHVKKVEDPSEISKNSGVIHLRVARLPVGFAVGGRGKAVTDARKRFEIRKTRRGMSFVRAGREIETVDAFPKSGRDSSSGLGDWPLLQSYAYHWGVEVQFGPELDEVFGITNDKQTVRPIEDFWRLLHEEDIDKLLHAENQWQTIAREKQVPKATPSDEPSPAEQAAAATDTVAGRPPQIPDHQLPKIQAAVEAEVQRQADATGKPKDEVRPAVLAAMDSETKRRKYKIDYYDDPNGPFFEPTWGFGTQIVIRINRQHEFYTAFYSDLLKLPGGTRAKEIADGMLIMLGRDELTVEDEVAKLFLENRRLNEWSKFLKNLIRILNQTLRPIEEREEDNSEAAAA